MNTMTSCINLQCLAFQNIPINTASSSSEVEFHDRTKRQTKALVPRQLPRPLPLPTPSQPLPSSAASAGSESLQSMDVINENHIEIDNPHDQVSISEKRILQGEHSQ